jgi:DNA-binding NarL/FixJ family response regulator/quercetin dioxygenase-like cupin family protein
LTPLGISSRQEWTVFLTIVVTDDSADYREIVRYLLASVSDVTIVGEAADGEEALAIVQRERPDIVITDLMMPRMNGIDLTRHIRQELPGTRIILMSSYTEDAYRLMASDSGADVFVSKGMIYDALLPAIRDLVARRVVQTPTLGDVLYANKAKALVSEKEWVGLVRATAGGDQSAMQALYTRTHRIVFTLIVRIINNREIAEELMGDVFHDVWRSAPGYDPAGGSVVGWIMNQARSRAIDWLRIAPAKGQESVVSAPHGPLEAEWEEVAPGISCNLLATDAEKDRVSMLVRLAPGAAYPPHRHAGVEELYLLDGELMIDDKTLHPGDYNRALPGTGDQHVWSETGCTCVLLTSTRDVLR